MDAISDPMVETVVIMASSQIGKTEVLNNALGYFISEDPSPILIIHPTLEMGSSWSKDRLAPMLRDTPCLQGKVQDVRSRDAGNTILHKVFPGGNLTISGANSAASLAGRPKRIVIADDVDRYPFSAGTEGDPILLAVKRTTAFWNRKVILCSTPTIKGLSRIESAYEASDRRRYWVPCPHCGVFQVLKWCQVTWPSPTNEGDWKAERHQPDRAVYRCAACGAALTQMQKSRMVAHGEWRAEAPCTGTAGFWLNELYSPWVPLERMVSHFLAAKKGGRLQLQVFANTSLAETWELEEGEGLDQYIYYGRREQYAAPVPDGVVLLTAGVDVQRSPSRIEIEVKGWGKGEESWGIEHRIFPGLTTDPEGGAWHDLDEYLRTTFRHASGVELPIACACIDTGDQTTEAYAFIRPRQGRRIFAVKGSKDRGKPLISRPRKSRVRAVMLFEVGTDGAKTTIYSRLKLDEPGPGYLHFPLAYDREYFDQLTAEKQVTSYRKGFQSIDWVKEPSRRNEALDLNVYALAALAILHPNLDRLAAAWPARVARLTAEAEAEASEDEPAEPTRPTPSTKPRRGFVNRWKS